MYKLVENPRKYQENLKNLGKFWEILENPRKT